MYKRTVMNDIFFANDMDNPDQVTSCKENGKCNLNSYK